MRILHVIRGLTNSSGTTHIVGPLSEEQARLGHDVAVYFVEKGTEPAVTPDPALVDSVCFPVTALKGHPGVSLPFARHLDRSMRSFDILHVHAIWNFPSFYSMRSARRAGIPYIVAPQGSLEPWALGAGSLPRRIYARHIEKPLLNSATRLQALTAREAAQFKDFGLRASAAVIPNGVQSHWLELPRGNLAADLGMPQGMRTLLFLSRIHPKKGLDILLRGFALFAREHADVVLVIAGGDAGSGYLKEVQALASELALSDRCRFVGEVRGEEKRRVLSGADAFALASHSEGLPVAVLEAMACGLPVVITPGCNLPEVRAADAGLIVEPQPPAVADALGRLFGDGQRLTHQGRNGRELVRERFTWPGIARITIRLYEDMRSEAKRGRLQSAA